jgi:glucose-1-phosphate cytidylyltransferase
VADIKNIKKVVLLAGGYGTRISEETYLKPKPMIEIGNKPILWHIMKYYSCYGIKEFIICLGYKGNYIKEYFMNYSYYNSDIRIDLKNKSVTPLNSYDLEDWKITLIDTGIDTFTGGRLHQVKDHLANEEDFFLTYGDGVSNVDLVQLNEFHKNQNKIATITSVFPPARFGAINIKDNGQASFEEKKIIQGSYINGGFFALSKRIFDYLDPNSMLEQTMEKLSTKGELSAYKHPGYWQCMDTLREKNLLEEQWKNNTAAWKIWN